MKVYKGTDKNMVCSPDGKPFQYELGKNGLSVARGNGCKVKGGLGAILVIAEEGKYSYDIKAWKAVVVDGETIKADTWYTLKDGELVEAD